MTDKEAANAVRGAADGLNVALAMAYNLGLTVDVQVMEMELVENHVAEMERRSRVSVYATISRNL